jgi:hypothetical protein
MSRERQKKLFVELINKQLEPFGKTYEEVVNVPNWYMNYQTTQEEQKKFIDYCADRISKELGLTKKMAEMEASWFILQWGLTTSATEYNQKESTELDQVPIEIKKKN